MQEDSWIHQRMRNPYFYGERWRQVVTDLLNWIYNITASVKINFEYETIWFVSKMENNLKFWITERDKWVNTHYNLKFSIIKNILVAQQLGNSHDIVSCMLYWIHLVVCERSVPCYIVYCVLKTYEKNFYKCIEFIHENYQQQSDAVV